MPRTDLLLEFPRGIHDGIDLPTQPSLGERQGLDNIGERCICDNHDVYVAGRLQRSASHGAMEQRDVNPRSEWFQSPPNLGNHAGGLENDALKFAENRRSRVDLIEDGAALRTPAQDPGRRQLVELANQCAGRRARDSDELPDVERFIWVTEEPAEQPPTRFAEEDGRKPVGRLNPYSTHSEYNGTHIEYAKSTCRVPAGNRECDGDYSDHPEELALLLDAIEKGADLAIGSRALGKREPGALLPQARFGNLLACFLIRLLYGHRYTDLGPFRAIRWDALRRIGMRDTDFGWTCEMQVKALRHGLKVAEVPVSYRRRVGVSKITGTLSGTLRAGWKILWTLVRYSFRS